MNCEAYAEYLRIRHASAFSIKGGKRRKVNQNLRTYTFADGSVLKLYKSGKATVSTNERGDVMLVGRIQTNAFGR